MLNYEKRKADSDPAALLSRQLAKRHTRLGPRADAFAGSRGGPGSLPPTAASWLIRRAGVPGWHDSGTLPHEFQNRRSLQPAVAQ